MAPDRQAKGVILRILRRIRRYKKPAPRFDVMVEDHVTLDGCELLGPVQVGYRSYANNSLLRNVKIGRYCSIGRRCSIGAALHDMDCFTTHSIAVGSLFVRDPQTVIGNDVWIGDNVVVVAGISIGDGAAIGAGAIVTRDVAPYAIVVGVPARLLRMRFDEERTAALLASQWWKFGDAVIEAAGLGAAPDVAVETIAGMTLRERQLSFHPWTPNQVL